MQIDTVGASGGHASLSVGAGVQATATSSDAGRWGPDPRGSAGVTVPGNTTAVADTTMGDTGFAGRSNGIGTSTLGFAVVVL
ncbi:MAG TPA: hypothetical protein VGD55_05535 [Acidothermaceae bacterium]